jgi:hypothetical protein
VWILLETEKYPPFFQESDRLAAQSQKKQFMLVRGKVSLLIVSALLLSIPWKIFPAFTEPAMFVVAILLVALIATTVAIQNKGLDSLWINCRAVAEAIKTETWLFMMQAQPYQGLLTARAAERMFIDRLTEILRLRPIAAAQIALNQSESPQVTPYMKEVRSSSLQNRRDHYVKKRIADQKRWYATKAVWNRRRESFWFSIGWYLELLAAVAAISEIVLPEELFDPVQVVSAASAGVLFWLNSRSYKEPAESYGVVANDLELQRNFAFNVETEEALSSLVSDTEDVITKEQKVWLARI